MSMAMSARINDLEARVQMLLARIETLEKYNLNRQASEQARQAQPLGSGAAQPRVNSKSLTRL
jgi:hypothetical protein